MRRASLSLVLILAGFVVAGPMFDAGDAEKPKSKAVADALEAYRKRCVQLEYERRDATKAAAKDLVALLEAEKRAAMKANDLAEANRIQAMIEAANAEFEPSGGAVDKMMRVAKEVTLFREGENRMRCKVSGNKIIQTNGQPLTWGTVNADDRELLQLNCGRDVFLFAVVNDHQLAGVTKSGKAASITIVQPGDR